MLITSALLCLAARVPPPANIVTAVALPRAPLLAARLDDPVWRNVDAVSDFRQWSPREGAAPSLVTTFRVAYDASNLYVLVRAFDPHPDSIVRTVTRRDGTSASDEIGIYIDSDEDHRTGYEFYVNAAGVLRDVALSNDGGEDVSWNGVWTAAARVDSAGWTAEFRIPFSQLRFPPGATHRFGFLVNRVIARRAERVSWPAYRPSMPGIVSQLGVLDGLRGIGASRDVEIAPFVRAQSRGAGLALGADARVALSTGFSINATALPDFGQVEADPSVVNLTSIETFYPEHRPFFLDGKSAYTVGFDCNAINCASEGLFYSRRIGRAPQLASLYGGDDAGPAPILAAAKITGRTSGGTTLAALASKTERVATGDGRTLEPATTYGVARVQRGSSDGQSGVSGVLTVVDRALDSWSAPYLVRSAIVTGGTFRHRFGGGEYEVWGDATESRLAGSSSAIAALQRSDVHLMQRPGAALAFDSTRRLLAGDEEELALGKYGGAFNFEGSIERQSPGYDSNDLGYLQRADQTVTGLWAGYSDLTPRAFYRSWRYNVNQWAAWNASGERIENALNTNAHINLVNNWWVSAGATLSQVGGVACDHCARGGPSMRVDPLLAPWVSIQGDPRDRIVPNLNFNWWLTRGGHGRRASLNPAFDARLGSRVQASIGVAIGENRDDAQWIGNFTDPRGAHSAFAHLDQHTRSVTLRASWAATPNVSLESYVAPFASDGTYADPRELSATPLASEYDNRFAPFEPPVDAVRAFAIRQLRATTVLRWEYAPGSTLFVVWSHERDGDAGDPGSWSRDVGDLLSLAARNTITVKASYWMGR